MTVILFLSVFTRSSSAELIIWANNGEDKVVQGRTRAATNGTNSVHNSLWDGTTISLFGAGNEVINFNLILESTASPTSNVNISFNTLTFQGTPEFTIRGNPVALNVTGEHFGEGLFNYVGRNIELFYVRYLQIKGLSNMVSGAFYDERSWPKRFQRPYGTYGTALSGTVFLDRPDANTFYPDIAVPLELHPDFTIAANQNQSIWCDIYIPKTAPGGIYTGLITVTGMNGQQSLSYQIPVSLYVHDFNLPDFPSGKTMLAGGRRNDNISERYFATSGIYPGSSNYGAAELVTARHAQMAHRHKISLINSAATPQSMDPIAVDALTGGLFSPERGYDGPGVEIGNNILCVGIYSGWWNSWFGSGAVSYNSDTGLIETDLTDTEQRTAIHTNSDAWINWINGLNLTTPTESFLYLIDEAHDLAGIEKWAGMLKDNTGPGSQLKSFATQVTSSENPFDIDIIPSLDIYSCTGRMLDVWNPDKPSIPDEPTWGATAESIINDPDKSFWLYNGTHRISGSFCIDEDGVSLRAKSWSQFKHKIGRWFFWESTYYRNVNVYGSTCPSTDVFNNAQTFGVNNGAMDDSLGEHGSHYDNGNGLLFYPGIDYLNDGSGNYTLSNDNYNIQGPIASLRLKYWRRGIQDIDYLTIASAINPEAVAEIVNEMIPKALWEYGCGDKCGAGYAHFGSSWSDDPDAWEEARLALANIISSQGPGTKKPTFPWLLLLLLNENDE